MRSHMRTHNPRMGFAVDLLPKTDADQMLVQSSEFRDSNCTPLNPPEIGGRR
jgi:hypothetical protein